MTTPEFIKLIKSCGEDRKKLLASDWESKEPTYLISESELDKIEKVNVELLTSLKELFECDYTSGTHLSCAIRKAQKAILNASNIKQI